MKHGVWRDFSTSCYYVNEYVTSHIWSLLACFLSLLPPFMHTSLLSQVTIMCWMAASFGSLMDRMQMCSSCMPRRTWTRVPMASQRSSLRRWVGKPPFGAGALHALEPCTLSPRDTCWSLVASRTVWSGLSANGHGCWGAEGNWVSLDDVGNSATVYVCLQGEIFHFLKFLSFGCFLFCSSSCTRDS